MRKGKFSIFLLTAVIVFASCMGLWAVGEDTPGNYSIGAVVSTPEHREEIACWYDDFSGTAWFFLPGYATMEQLQLLVQEDGMYQIGGIPVQNGMTCEMFTLGEVYPLTFSEDADLEAEYVAFAHSGGVSTLFVDVQTGSMDYLHEDKSHKEPAAMRLYDGAGTLTYAGNVQSIGGRGQSSWNEEKKSYNLTLTREADLLGMGSAQKWVLQANAKDPSHIRNKMVHDFADAVGLEYSPDCQWVDVYFNGEYAGLYLLCEKIEIHPQRVDISETGSFLMVKDGDWRFAAQGEAYIQTREKTALGIRYADFSQMQLQSIWQSVENAIMAEDGIDPVTGKNWLDLIDLESWVKKHLIEEVFGNQDAMMLSQYYYMDGSGTDGRIYAGPVWDYDLVMRGEATQLYAIRPNNYGTLWPPELYKKEAYYSRLTELYEDQFRPMLLWLMESGIADYSSAIRQAARMNEIRWYTPNARLDAEKIAAYMQQRIYFLDRLWLQEEPFVMLQVLDASGVESYYALEMGATLAQLPEYADSQYIRYLGWHDSVTGEKVDLDAPIYEDKSVFMKYETLPQPESGMIEETEPLRKTQLIGAVAFSGMLAMLLAAEWLRQRREKEKIRRAMTGNGEENG